MSQTTTEGAGHRVPPTDTFIAQDAVFLLEKLGALGSIDANRALEEHGLKVRSYSTLSLACGEEPPTQKALAEMLSLDPSQIVAIVDSLEKKGLVERAPSTKDRRVKLIQATKKGKELTQKIQVDLLLARETTFQQLSSAEIKQLTLLLHKAVYGEN